MRRLFGFIISIAFVFTIYGMLLPVYASDSYRTIYADAFSDAYLRHDKMIEDGVLDNKYNTISYSLCDISGDQFKELIIRQVNGKHNAYYWIYGYNGTSDVYLGEFTGDVDFDGLFGYQQGVLFRESYKGFVSLCSANWDGSSFIVNTLYEGEYDRSGSPPSVYELSAYYDSQRLLEQAPDFTECDELSLLEEIPSIQPTDDIGGSRVGSIEGREWKAAYKAAVMQAIHKYGNTNSVTCHLVCIDRDDIPEVVLYNSAPADEVTILNWYNGTCLEFCVPNYFQCIEKSGLIDSSHYHDGYNMTYINMLVNGTLTLLGEGIIEETSGDATEPQYTYTWNDVSITEDQYNNNYHSLFDSSRVTDNYDYSYPEILREIDSYGSDSEVSVVGTSEEAIINETSMSEENSTTNSESNSVADQLAALEAVVGIDNSDKKTYERIELLETELGLNSGHKSVPERIAAIGEMIGIDPSVSATDFTDQEEYADTEETMQEASNTDSDSKSIREESRRFYPMTFVSSDVSDYPDVKLYFSLDDENGNPIILSSFDGKIKEGIANGAQIERTIRNIERLEGNQGLSIDIVADKSGSMEYDLPTMQSIMSDFVRSLDYSVGDRAEILSFDSYVMYMCTYTKEVDLLLNGISNMTPYGETALYDALITGIGNAGSRAGARCVIGFTDGMDNMSVYTPEDVIRLAKEMEVPVYLIGTGGADSSTLNYIANSTGGYYWDVYNITDISSILSMIYRDQKDLYCIRYESDPGADPYSSRVVDCFITDNKCVGQAEKLVFQATPTIQTTAHNSRYELVKADVSWQQANESCIAKGGHLVTINSQSEMNEIVRMCQAAGLKYCWIGGYTSVRNGVAFGHWITGEPFNFTSWYRGEPSRNDLDGTPEFYLMLWNVEGVWSWNDERNDVVADYDYFKGVIGYVCEYES